MWRNRLYYILSIIAFGLLYVFTSITVIIIFVPAAFRFRRPVREISHLWARSVFFIIGKKLYIQGKENIRKKGKYILVANHSSLFDIMAIMSVYPDVSWLGHKRLVKIPVFGTVLKMTGYIPMRNTGIKNTRKMIEQLMKKSTSKIIAMFPEGTRTTDGKVNRFYRGFIHLLRASDINLLPVTLKGLFLLKPKTRFHINFSSKINIIIHPPIERESLINKTDEEIIRIVKEIIESPLEYK